MTNENPQPVLRKAPWTTRLIWIIPLCALVWAGFFLRDYLQNRGPTITIELSSADGLRVNNTPVTYRGVGIGQVAGLSLTKNRKHALIEVRLTRGEESFAREGASFWVVRPEFSGAGLAGLNTLISGPYIEATPGEGDLKTEFVGMEKTPLSFGAGLNIYVHATRIEHIQEKSPVYYHSVQVGEVREVRLSRDASRVEAHLVIWHRYAPLVKTGSRFWAASGFEVKGGLFSGIDLKLQSLKSLISGGIAFATPEKNMGEEAKPESDFELSSELKKEWLTWSPRIQIKPENSHTEE